MLLGPPSPQEWYPPQGINTQHWNFYMCMYLWNPSAAFKKYETFYIKHHKTWTYSTLICNTWCFTQPTPHTCPWIRVKDMLDIDVQPAAVAWMKLCWWAGLDVPKVVQNGRMFFANILSIHVYPVVVIKTSLGFCRTFWIRESCFP